MPTTETYMPLITTSVDRAVLELQKANPVAIPTETVYGLAAPVDSESAIKAVFHLKNRPLNHPLIVHVAANQEINLLVHEIPDCAQLLMRKFWPGPLTLVFHAKKDQINPLITGGQDTVAIRCPAHPMAQELLVQLNIPLVAPSANSFGRISPTTAEHVRDSFPNHKLTILDGGRCSVGIESTIVDVSTTNSYQILRHGFIDEKSIEKVIGFSSVHEENNLRVPGKLDRHYQPQKKLYYFSDHELLSRFCQKKAVYVIANNPPSGIKIKHFRYLGENPQKAAFNLYYQLRAADMSDVEVIAIELPPASEIWKGVRERILKAGLPYVEDS